MKTIHFTDFIDLVQPILSMSEQESNNYVSKKFKKYYNQVQIQLFCSKLDSANLTFVSVDSYDDEENMLREIQENEIIKVRIHRNEKVISEIVSKGVIFQTIKDFFNGLTSCKNG